ncbi:FeoA family protein [Mariniphaga sediminis]|jgi:ferrous iron transport protein A|uniref:FeoA family protein n=1 Tax=Mariniphaga sediminis TaxID=1628158 RepID=UPI0019D41A22|nr:FeoA family protein [Mariniphaga sediminis]
MLNKVIKNTIAHLKKGEKGIIGEYSTDAIPVKLQEMGCLPGNEVQLIQLSPFNDLLYLNISGSYFAIRRETAALIEIAKAE